MERELPAETVAVHYVCDSCGRGQMLPKGTPSYLTDPMQFPHECTACGHTQVFACRYPHTRVKSTFKIE